MTNFGAFVEIEEGIDGLLHISDLSWGRISHPSEVVELDQEIECVVVGVDKEHRITSYNVCYTKLLRLKSDETIEAGNIAIQANPWYMSADNLPGKKDGERLDGVAIVQA